MNMGQRSLQRKLFIPIDTFNFVAKIKISSPSVDAIRHGRFKFLKISKKNNIHTPVTTYK